MLKTSIKKKILTSFYANTFGILIITLLFFSSYSYEHYVAGHTIQRLRTLAKLTASLIDSNDFNKLVSSSDEKSEAYKKIKNTLINVKKSAPDIKFVYTMRKTDKKDIWEFVVGTEDVHSKDFSHLGDKYDVSQYEQMKKAFDGPLADLQIETDQWGSTLSGYALIRDQIGRAVGIVGIDIEAQTLMENEKDFLLGAIIMVILSFALTAYTISITIKGFLEPVKEIIEGIKHVSNGNFENRVKVNTGDEFEIMADMVNNTANVMINYQKMMEESLNSSIQQRKKIFKVYSDVIYSVTQGKFNLVSYKDSITVADGGVLKDEIKVEIAEDVGKVRNVVERDLTPRGFSEGRIQKILLCISEAATNVIKHAKEGMVQIRVLDNAVRLVVLDHGPGMDIDRLPNMVFLKGFSTKISLGVGFSIMYGYADKIYLSTSKNGTFVAMDFNLEQ